MNIIKLQDMLRGVPDDALIGYVQNPQGQVPSYLALSELQRRKDTRAKYQQEQAPETSVAEDLGQQAQPPAPQAMLAGQPQMQMEDQGVAALPTGDMFQEQNFAGGGIVAFEDGGRVSPRAALNPYADEEGQIRAAQYLAGANVGSDRFNVGADMAGMVDKRGFTDPRLQAIYANYVTDEGNRYGASYNPDARQASVERMSKEGNRLGVDFAPDRVGVSGEYRFANGGGVKHYKKGDYVLSSDYDPEAYGAAYREGLAGLDTTYPTYSATDPYGNVRKKAIKEYKSSVKTPYDDAIKYYEEQGLGYKGKLGAVPYTTPVRKLENARDEWLASQGTMPTTPVTKPSNEPDVRLTGDAAQNAAKQPFQGVGFDGSFYDKMLKKEKTLQELSDEYKAVLGTDPTLAGRQEKLAKMEARAKRMEDMAPGMAMLEAGLGIAAGTSPFALANIGKGAMAGVKSYGDAQNKLADLEEKRFSLDTELAKQQRAEQVAAVTYGVNSRQHTEEINKSIMLAKAKDKLTRDVANLEANVAVSKAGVTNAPKIKEIAEARAAYQGSKAQNEVKKALLKRLGDNADKDTSDRHNEYLDGLRIAEEQHLANYFAPIGSNMPRASTQGFEITKPKK
jgi:hypothetical protein